MSDQKHLWAPWKMDYLENKKGDSQKIFLDKEGKVFFDSVYNKQRKRIFNALKNSSSDSVIKFKEVLNKIIDGKK